MAKPKNRREHEQETFDGTPLEALESLVQAREELPPKHRRLVERIARELDAQRPPVEEVDEPAAGLRVIRSRPGRHDHGYVPAGYHLHPVPPGEWRMQFGRGAGKPGMLVQTKVRVSAREDGLARDAVANILGHVEPLGRLPERFTSEQAQLMHEVHKLVCGFDLRANDGWAAELAAALRRWVEHREEARVLKDSGARAVRSSFRPTKAFAAWLALLGAPDDLDVAVFERAIRECSLGGRGRGLTPERWVENYKSGIKKKRTKTAR